MQDKILLGEDKKKEKGEVVCRIKAKISIFEL